MSNLRSLLHEASEVAMEKCKVCGTKRISQSGALSAIEAVMSLSFSRFGASAKHICQIRRR